MADCNDAVRLNAGDANGYANRGIAHLKSGEFGAANDDFAAALRLGPTSAMLLYGRGLAYLGQKDGAKGLGDIGAAKDLDPDIGDKFRQWGVAGPQ